MKCASNTVIQVLQRGAKAEDMEEGLSQEGPIGSYSVTIVQDKIHSLVLFTFQ